MRQRWKGLCSWECHDAHQCHTSSHSALSRFCLDDSASAGEYDGFCSSKRSTVAFNNLSFWFWGGSFFLGYPSICCLQLDITSWKVTMPECFGSWGSAQLHTWYCRKPLKDWMAISSGTDPSMASSCSLDRLRNPPSCSSFSTSSAPPNSLLMVSK